MASNATEFMDPSAPAPTPAPLATPAPAHQTSYLPPAAPQTDPLIGQMLTGRYLIRKKLGEGGMGAVYLASHQLLEKDVALKVLHNEFARKPDLVERFIQEAKAASRIRHENVIDISDFGTTPEGLVFFAMELLNGHDLHEEIARARLAGQLLPFSRTKKIFLQICSALSAAHSRGIVHRDLKPENIYLVDFLGEGDFVKLLDFGIAKLTEVNEEGRKLTKTGMLFGTPEYMSPEQARGEHVDHRVDVYAMGCILFQLVTGRVPFEAENFMGVLSMHLTEPPPEIPAVVFERIGAPAELAFVIDRALHKNRDQRYQTIDDLANAVREVCGDPIVDPASRNTASQTAVRAASVQAPERTTQARVTPAPVTPGTNPPTDTRQRTQWTGSLQVPTEEVSAPRQKSKLPMIIGGILVAGAAAAAVFFATRGPKQDPGTNVPSASTPSGSQVAIVTPPPDASTVPPPATLPDQAEITLDTDPPGAEIIDVLTNKSRGTTPDTFKVTGSNNPRQFELKKKGYKSIVIELVPNKEKLAPFKEKLEKGVGSTTIVQSGSATPGPGSSKPVPGVGTGSAVAVKPPDPTPGSGSAVTVKPPVIPDPPDCDEPGACIKTNLVKKCSAKTDCPTGLDCIDGTCK
jgi:serine/threonine protein kinase